MSGPLLSDKCTVCVATCSVGPDPSASETRSEEWVQADEDSPVMLNGWYVS